MDAGGRGQISDSMKTLFLNPPSFRGYDGGAGSRYQARREIRSFWYPTWLAQAAALVEESRVVDAPADDLSPADVMRIARDYELIVVYTSTGSFANDSTTALLIKKTNPDALIAFVGPHVTVLPEESLRQARAVDFVVRKEFDISIQRIAGGEHFSKVDGVSWRDGDTVRHNPDPPVIADLDALPFVVDVYRRDLTIENYYIGYLWHPYLSLYAGRGCSSRCTFCLWPQTISGHEYRVRSPRSVQSELARAMDYFPQVQEYFIDDDTFTADPERAASIAKLISDLGITWSTSSRVNASHETLKALKDSGLRLLMVGFESGSDAILRNARKGADTDMARRFMGDCRSLGIAVHGTFMLGLPGETSETIRESITFAREIAPDTIQVSIATPYPGTQLYRQAMENGWLGESGILSRDGAQTCALSYDGLSSQEVLDSVDTFYKRFYFRPRVLFDMGRQMLADPAVRKRRMREGREFISFLRRKGSSAPAMARGLRDILRTGGPGYCQFAITNACNAKCRFCNFAASDSNNRASVFTNLDDSRLALDILAARGIGHVLFVGGEPTLHPDLPDMLAHASGLGMKTMISTNGWLLSEDRIRSYCEAGLNSVVISVDAQDTAVHEANRGLPDLCSRITEANALLAKAGILSTASVTVSKLLGDYASLAEFVRRLGFGYVTFSYPQRKLESSYLGWSNSDLLDFSDDELVAAYGRIIAMKREIRVINPTPSLRDMQRLVRGQKQRFPCLAGYKYFHLDWDFNLYRCHAWPEPLCSVWEFDDSKLVRDGCTKCMIDCYRDSSVLQYIGIALHDARRELLSGRVLAGLRKLIDTRVLESARAVLEDMDWIRGL